MKTRLTALALAAALGALAGASGCTTENRASVQTQAICMPTTACTFSAKCDAQYIGYPTVDKAVDTTGTLWLFLQIGNLLENNANVALGRTNTNDAHIDETSIEYEGAMGGTQVVGSNYLVPAAGTSVVSAKLSLANAVAGEVVAHVRFRGYYDDGSRFETGDFPITIVVCASGCAPAACAGLTTCPPNGEGQRPLVCGSP